MESVKKARSRLSAYPKLVSSCAAEAACYGKCVAQSMGEVKKSQCQAEFDALKNCVLNAAKKAGTKV